MHANDSSSNGWLHFWPVTRRKWNEIRKHVLYSLVRSSRPTSTIFQPFSLKIWKWGQNWNPDWSPRDDERWTELFQRFDVFQNWFREHEKHQRWSWLFQSWSALTFSEPGLFRTEELSAEQRCLRENPPTSMFRSSETLGFQCWEALIYSESALILTHVD